MDELSRFALEKAADTFVSERIVAERLKDVPEIFVILRPPPLKSRPIAAFGAAPTSNSRPPPTTAELNKQEYDDPAPTCEQVTVLPIKLAACAGEAATNAANEHVTQNFLMKFPPV